MRDKLTINFQNFATNQIRLHTALAGPVDGEPLILLHGFPDAWFGWEAQIEPLAAAGFRVIVPDQRGYNLSDKPKGVASYQMGTLVNDILGLADTLGYERFHLGGHDFGAMVSWNLARQYPGRIKCLAIANVPHPRVMSHYLQTHPKQMKKSWYVFFFQIPSIPEWIVRVNNWQFLISAMPDDFSEDERDRYREAWEQPGAMIGMINWYRDYMRQRNQSTAPIKIQVPTIILWGKNDPYISYEMAHLSVDLCQDGRLNTFKDATHWVLHDEPEATSRLLVQNFSEHNK